jgi:hypothetical protein
MSDAEFDVAAARQLADDFFHSLVENPYTVGVHLNGALNEIDRLRKVEKMWKRENDILDRANGKLIDERDSLRKQRDILAEALRSVASGSHEGVGFCYAVTGHRPCRCHVHDAAEALKAAGLEVEG